MQYISTDNEYLLTLSLLLCPETILEGGLKQICCPVVSSVSLYFLRNSVQAIAERIDYFPTHACISI